MHQPCNHHLKCDVEKIRTPLAGNFVFLGEKLQRISRLHARGFDFRQHGVRREHLPPIDSCLVPVVSESYFELCSGICVQHDGMRNGFDHETTLSKELEHVVVLKFARVLGFVVLQLLLALHTELEIGLREVVLGH